MYYTRALGHRTLQHEIERSRHADEPFVLAFVDIDGLEELSHGESVVAGAALLRDVITALRSNLRFCDPIVRVGGDEFLCAFTNTELPTARRRIEEIRGVLEATRAASPYAPDLDSISVGLASLRESDTLELLTARADIDMYSHKQTRRRLSRKQARPAVDMPVQASADGAPGPAPGFGGWELAGEECRGWAPSGVAGAFDPWPAHKPGPAGGREETTPQPVVPQVA